MRVKASLVTLTILGLLCLPGIASAQATCGDTLVCSGSYAMYIKAQSGTLGLWVRAQNKNAIQAYAKSKIALLAVSPNSHAARFISEALGTYAVWATSEYGGAIYGDSEYGHGVYGKSIDTNGVIGQSTGGDLADNGVYGVTNSTSSGCAGVYGYSTPSFACGVIGYSHFGNGVRGDTARSDKNYGLFTYDNVYIGGKIDLLGTVDPVIGERFEFDPEEGLEVGGVMVIDDDSQYVTRCSEAYDTKVIGIIGPDVDVKNGEVMVITFGNRGAQPVPDEDGQIAERTIIRVKVDAKYGAIKRGDLLTTSPTPGHAMKAVPVDIEGVEIYRPGTIIGKALESLESGTGLIEVFVMNM